MHDYFGEWYRTAGIPPDSVPLAERWKAVEAFEPDSADVALLTQLFFQLTLSDSSFPETFRKALHDSDVTMQMSGNDNELIVLAGAELIDFIGRGKRESADFAALCLVCAGVQNLRQNPLVPDIPDRAAKYLKKRSENRDKPGKNGPQGKLFDGLTAAGEPYSALAIEFQKLQLRLPTKRLSNSSSGGNLNLSRPSVTNHVDEYTCLPGGTRLVNTLERYGYGKLQELNPYLRQKCTEVRCTVR